MDATGECVVDEDQNSPTPNPTPELSRLRVFVTSSRFQGDSLGGISQADAHCQNAASAAGLGGSFRAWISEVNNDAISGVPNSGPWYTVDRTELVFNNRSNWATTPIRKISIDENGTDHSDDTYEALLVWTGTHSGGLAGDYEATCGNWSEVWVWGVFGILARNTSEWTDWSAGLCDKQYRLYCYEF